MLTEAEFAEQQRQLGRRIHEHDGVWWETKFPFYTKPAFEFRAFAPRSARPKWSRSFLGYSHQVPQPEMGNRLLEFMVLDGESLRGFGMARLGPKKRNQVRKGLKHCHVELISDLMAHLEEAREINITQSQRQMATGSFDRPMAYYSGKADVWRKEMLARFGLKGWCWWGAFSEGRLVAYMQTLAVEGKLMIMGMKSHTSYLPLCPVDAIYFTVLSQAAGDAGVEQVVNGRPQRESLDRYKEQFLFRRVVVQYFTVPIRCFRFGVQLLRAKEFLRMRFVVRGPERPTVDTGAERES